MKLSKGGKGTESLGSLEGKTLILSATQTGEAAEDKKGFTLHLGQLCHCFCAAQVFRIQGGEKKESFVANWDFKKCARASSVVFCGVFCYLKVCNLRLNWALIRKLWSSLPRHQPLPNIKWKETLQGTLQMSIGFDLLCMFPTAFMLEFCNAENISCLANG